MANEFKKLTEKEVVESVSENGHLFAEDGGKVVRVPVAGVGGGSAAFYISNGRYMFKSPQGAIAEDETDKVSRDEFVAALNRGVVRLYEVFGAIDDFYYANCFTITDANLEGQGITAHFKVGNDTYPVYTKEVVVSDEA